MSTDAARSAHDDVIAKMDALLKRHHERLEKSFVVPAAMDFPLLTEEVSAEDEIIPVLTEVVEEKAEMSDFPFLLLEEAGELQAEESTLEELSSAVDVPPPENPGPQIEGALDPGLSEHIVSAVDRAISTVLEQFAAQLEVVVREAVAKELQKQLGEIAGRARDANDAGE